MPAKTENCVEITGLTKVYPGQRSPALDSVTFEIAQGDFFGLLGPNGAGKTTLISILCGILRPSAGAVSVFGVDALRHPGPIKARIGYVPQSVALYEELTARENFLLFGRLYGLGGARLHESVDRCFELCGIGDKADDRVSTLSGGMKRLANLMVGVIHEPSLLILDEPTVGVDIHSRHRIHETLVRMHKSGVCMIYTSHYLEEAERLCTRIAVIDEGRIATIGGTAELLEQKKDCHTLEDLFIALTGKEIRG